MSSKLPDLTTYSSPIGVGDYLYFVPKGGAASYNIIGGMLPQIPTQANLTDLLALTGITAGQTASVIDCGISGLPPIDFVYDGEEWVCSYMPALSDASYLDAFPYDLLNTLPEGISIYVNNPGQLYFYGGGVTFVLYPAGSYVFTTFTSMIASEPSEGTQCYCTETRTNYTYSASAPGWRSFNGVPSFDTKADLIAYVNNTANYNRCNLPGTQLIDGDAGVIYLANGPNSAEFSGQYPSVTAAVDLASIDTTFFVAGAVSCYAQDTGVLYFWMSGTNWVAVKPPTIATSNSVSYGGAITQIGRLIDFQKTGNIVIATFKQTAAGPVTSADYITLPAGSIPANLCPDAGLNLMLSTKTGVNQLTNPGSGISTTPADLTFIVNSDGSVQIAVGSFNTAPALNSGQFPVGNYAGFFDTTLTWTNNS